MVPQHVLSFLAKPPRYTERLNEIARDGRCNRSFSPRLDVTVDVAPHGAATEPLITPVPRVLFCPHCEVDRRVTFLDKPARYDAVLNDIARCDECHRGFSTKAAAVVLVRE